MEVTNIPRVTWTELKFLEAKTIYESYRKELHSNFIREKARCSKTNPKSFWQHINSKRKVSNVPAVIEFNGTKATTNAEKTNLFAEYFKSVYADYQIDPSLVDFILNRNDDNYQSITSPQELVLSVLRKIDLNKGSGHDGVAALFLRECAVHLAEPLSIIYNQSLSTKCYPEVFKIG